MVAKSCALKWLLFKLQDLLVQIIDCFNGENISASQFLINNFYKNKILPT